MRSIIFSVMFALLGSAVCADSVHNRKVTLIGGDRAKIDSKGRAEIEEVSRFVGSRCALERNIRISVQPVFTNPRDAKFAKVIEKTELPDRQVFAIPGGVSEDYLRRNDVFDILPKVKNPVVVEVFC